MMQGVLFLLAGASLFGLTGFLFRDEIPRERWFKRDQREPKSALLRLMRAPVSDAAPEL